VQLRCFSVRQPAAADAVPLLPARLPLLLLAASGAAIGTSRTSRLRADRKQGIQKPWCCIAQGPCRGQLRSEARCATCWCQGMICKH
jgi:hypothetical protein